jgi:hypothetical protein
MTLLILGGLLIAAANILDAIFRERMTRAGDGAALWLGGAFNYAEYHRIRTKYGWAAWPVYMMWAMMICGIGLLMAGCFLYFGK